VLVPDPVATHIVPFHATPLAFDENMVLDDGTSVQVIPSGEYAIMLAMPVEFPPTATHLFGILLPNVYTCLIFVQLSILAVKEVTLIEELLLFVTDTKFL
jgi:hypothetical protein